MGIYLCSKHSRQGFYEVCRHLHSSLENGEYPEMFSIPLHNTKICKSCYSKADIEQYKGLTFSQLSDLSKNEIEKIDQTLGEVYDNLNRKIICLECDKEYQKKQLTPTY